MAKLGRAVARGVQAGLLHFGAKMEQDEERERQDKLRAEERERVDQRLAKEDAFKERQLSIQEEDARIRADAAKRQKFFDDTKIKHAKLVKGLSGAGENMNLQAEALTNFFPDQRIYKFNPRAAKEKGIWGQMDVSFLDKDPVTGEVKVDELTGLPKEVVTKAPTDNIEFKTRADYERYKSTVASPEMYLAYASQDLTTDMAIKQSNRLADAVSQQPKGKADLAKTKAETDRIDAQTRLIEKEIKMGKDTKGKTVGSVIGLDGKEKTLTTAEVNQLINDTKSLKDKYIGITGGEAYRISQAMQDPNRSKGLLMMAQDVINNPERKSTAIQDIMTEYRVSKQTATDILSEASGDMEETNPSWWDNLMNSDAATEDTPATMN